MFNNPAALYEETAVVLEQTDAALITNAKFFDTKGCMCALGHVVYKHNERARAVVDGFRAMRGILDEDQLDIIANEIDTFMWDAAADLAPTHVSSDETIRDIMRLHDRFFSAVGVQGVVWRLRAKAQLPANAA